jgi:aquaporin Z
MEKCLFKKMLAECLGTFVLVFFACGTAIVTYMLFGAVNVVATALAFGLAVVAMAYAIGGISGCHINPAVSLGAFLSKRMTAKGFGAYALAQLVGATVGAAVLYAILCGTGYNFDFGIWATNAVAGSGAAGYFSSIALEIVMTFVFVYVILAVTSKQENSSIAGLIIGLTLTLVHLVGINLTGTSVNPARSVGPALMQAAFGGGAGALAQVWVFIVAPLIGAALAAVCFGWLNTCKTEKLAD